LDRDRSEQHHGGTGARAPDPPSSPQRWNKFTVPAAIADVVPFFGDAAIVWKGNAAYSANPTTTELIKTTAGVTARSARAANDEIWVAR
jgi:hypothetical protein